MFKVSSDQYDFSKNMKLTRSGTIYHDIKQYDSKFQDMSASKNHFSSYENKSLEKILMPK